MPDDVTNQIIGAKETVAKIGGALKGDAVSVDFNRLIPMPKILALGPYLVSIGYRARACLSGYPVSGPCPKDMSDDEFDTFILYLRALRETGHDSATSWRCSHWGTKWNAYDVKVEENAITFTTASDCPDPIVEALAKSVPDSWVWSYVNNINGVRGTWTCKDGSLGWDEPDNISVRA